MKRILKVWIEKRQDESPDTSHLGEYGSEAKSEFAINRKERGDWERNQFEWFNPNHQNYAGEKRTIIEKYCEEDYRRMESLNRGDWYYLGVTAKAKVQLTGDLWQTITSGGLWGVESDSGPNYLKTIADEQLAELRGQLLAIGFSAADCDKAFATVGESVK